MPIEISGRTISEVFQEAVNRYGGKPFLMAPPSAGAQDSGVTSNEQMRSLSYEQVGAEVSGYIKALQKAGYGAGNRIAVLMGNRLDHLVVMLAFNSIGISIVPINPDYRAGEVAYLLQDSTCDMIIVEASRADLARTGLAESGLTIPVLIFEDYAGEFSHRAAEVQTVKGVTPQTEASLIYTSGTTGRPKGCIIGHEYSLMIGERYINMGGKAVLREGEERIYNPLPLYHVNAMILSFYGALLSGNCQIAPDRFSKSTWWSDLEATGTTIFHYLGIIIPALLSAPPTERDRSNTLRFGMGAGVEPELHGVFEERFGMPLIEGWGMTEMCRVFVSSEEPRQIDTRAVGAGGPDREVRVVDGEDRDVPDGTPGELLIRHSSKTPRKGFFSGYLNREAETEESWRGGWFHTGDTVVRDSAGMVYFVDRKKNVIRRSGENIAAAEVEDCLYGDDRVAQVAVIVAPDDMREEEVFACIVVKDGVPADQDLARQLFDHCFEHLAYYKPPGWILFVDSLPVTGTQKVLKHKIFPQGTDPRQKAGVFDFRELKRR